MRLEFKILYLKVIFLGAMLLGSSLFAQNISNTAFFDYTDSSGVNQTIQSNTVIESISPSPTPSEINFYHYANSNGDLTINSSNTQCFDGTDFNPAPIPVTSAGSLISTSTLINLNNANAYHISEPIYVTLRDFNRNLDSSIREFVEVTITTSNGDSERLQLQESTINSGLFVGSVQSVATPPSPTHNDCQLSLEINSSISASYTDTNFTTDISETNVLVDPFGTVYNSQNGAEINNVLVRLVNAADGSLATVFADDGVTPYPAEVITGSSFTVGSELYTMPNGGYRFPLIPPGNYRLEIFNIPLNFTSPSIVPENLLRLLRDSNNDPYSFEQGYLGEVFVVQPGPALNIDIPIDPPSGDLVLRKNVFKTQAQIGDFVPYQIEISNTNLATAQDVKITDNLPRGFKIKKNSITLDGNPVSNAQFVNSKQVIIPIGDLTSQQTKRIKYVLEVTIDAPINTQAINTAIARSGNDLISNQANAIVNITSPFLTNQTTIIGEVLDIQNCHEPFKDRKGLKNVKILMEDGTFVVTDENGKFHFQDVISGTHVIRAVETTLPDGYRLQLCEDNSCHATKQNSQFVDLQPGSLWRVIFHAKRTQNCYDQDNISLEPKIKTVSPNENLETIKVEQPSMNWLKGEFEGNKWLYPSNNANASYPSSIVAIKHRKGENVQLLINGQEVSSLLFNKVSKNRTLGVYVSDWSAIPLKEGRNIFEAKTFSPDGSIIKKEQRVVYYSNSVAKIEYVPEKSILAADGINPIKIAYRVLNRNNNPVRKGAKITYRVSSPYLPNRTVMDLQQNLLQIQQPQFSEMVIENDEGIAYAEVAPTQEVGEIQITIEANRDSTQDFTAWLKPAGKEWVVIGFAEGSYGYKTLQTNGVISSNINDNLTGQAKFYAKGKIKGEWIATIAYNSEKQRNRREQNFGSTIDPDRFYTLYADNTNNQKDAASSEKLYLRLEKTQFYALFGDYQSGLNETRLTYYDRTFTGLKSEYDGKIVGFKVFGAELQSKFQRDESQATGFGNLRLNQAPIIFNSDKIRIQVRDKFNSSLITNEKTLTRYIDYDIDFFTGVINFKNLEDYQPRDFNGNPRFIITEYETDQTNKNDYVFGGRAELKILKDKIRIGASHINEDTTQGRNYVEGLDARIKITQNQEIRLEAARSENNINATPTSGKAYRAEYNKIAGDLTIRAYAQKVDNGFGIGQEATPDKGSTRYGALARYIINEKLRAEIIHDNSTLATSNKRKTFESSLIYTNKQFEARLGARKIEEEIASIDNSTTQLNASLRKSFFKNQFEIEARAEHNIENPTAQSVDFPNIYLVKLAYRISQGTKIIFSNQLADGNDFSTFTTRLGLESSPWSGGQFKSGVNQEFSESGIRSFANMGFLQTFQLSKKWQLDFALDSAKIISGDPTTRVFDRNNPISSGGLLGNNNFTENYRSASLGTNYRKKKLSWTTKFEFRQADSESRYSVQNNIIKELSRGSTISSRTQYLSSRFNDSSKGYSLNSEISYAYRPIISKWSILNRFNFRYESLNNSQGLDIFSATNPTTSDSKLLSGALVNNFNLNRISRNKKNQFSIYYGSKYAFDKIDSQTFKGYTDMLGFEARKFIGRKFDIGLQTYALNSWSNSTHKYAIGPSLGFTPMKNAWLSVGYNFGGFTDKDFTDARYTNSGVFLKFRFKFDEKTLGLASDKQKEKLLLDCAPPVAQLPAEVEGSMINIGRVHFTPDNAIFSQKEERHNLDRLVQILNDYPQIKKVRIEGHTDSQNTDEYNNSLAWRRSKRVLNYLLEQGISIDRLEMKSFGESKPIADNNTEIGRYLNRRVEFRIIDPEGGFQ